MRSVALLVLCSMAAFGDPRVDKRVRKAMKQMIQQQEVPGAVTAVVTREGVTHLASVGYAEAGRKRKLRQDSIFWIASMTKPIIGVSILMLEDAGKLSIEDKLGKYLLEFADSPVTLHHMLTHTSGLEEATPEELARAKTLADLVPIYAAKPLKFTPGEKWVYCQTGINLLGRVIEVASGQALPEFLEKNLLRPLGMKDTTFYLSEAQLERLTITARLTDGKLVDGVNPILQGRSPTDRERYPAANGGLYSTAVDYARFARMLLRGGELDGRRYLSPGAFAKLRANQTGSLKAGFIPGSSWGLAVGVVEEPQGQTALLRKGTFGHGGAHGTQAWIDPEQNVALILMVQRANFKNSDDSPVRLAFTSAALGR